jgi:serine/threonine-protein kinase RsbW
MDGEEMGTSSTELRVLADARNLSTVRALVATYVSSMDFDLDAIDDIILALDEACSRLLPCAGPSAELRCGLNPTDSELRVYVAVQPMIAEPPAPRGFGWNVLTSVADSADTGLMKSPWSPNDVLAAVTFTKKIGSGQRG